MSEAINSAQEWLRYAQSDLAYAHVPCPPGGLLETLCFHAQQAAEKCLKAALIYLGVPFPRTHNINTLIELFPPNIEIPEDVQNAKILTDYAVVTRYPGEHETISPEEFQEALRLTEAVIEWVKSEILEEQHDNQQPCV